MRSVQSEPRETHLKTITRAVIAAVFACAAPAALAETTFYGNIGYSAFDGDGGTLSAITARGGAQFTPNFGAEIEGSFGAGGEEFDGVDLDLSNQFGAYAVGYLPLGESFNLLGRIGYGTATIEGSVPGLGSADVDLNGVLVGLGGEYMFTKNMGVRGDYTRFEANDDDIDGGVDIFAISAVYKFGAAN